MDSMFTPCYFHMDSMLFPHGLHVISTWTPCYFHMDSMLFPHGLHVISTWTQCYFHMDSMLFPHGLHVISTWTPHGLHMDYSSWTPHGLYLYINHSFHRDSMDWIPWNGGLRLRAIVGKKMYQVFTLQLLSQYSTSKYIDSIWNPHGIGIL